MEHSIEVQELSESVEELSNLLDSVILNRNKRRAKQVVKTGIEFLMSVALLLYTIHEQENDYGIAPSGLALAMISMSYVCAIMFFITVHAYRLPPEFHTTPAIEEAYKKTNNWPIIDGFMEIPLPYRFGGAVVAYTFWSVFFLLFLVLMVTLALTYSGPYVLSSFLATFTLYDLTSELCEYWVHTRPQNMMLPSSNTNKQARPNNGTSNRQE
ncbi:hypothetical protein ACA910_011259 [Epithemia clementina (nom. ined.)]